MTDFFTADLHLGHKNILIYSPDRPGSSIEEHNEILLENWNSRVGDGDNVYVLGDFFFMCSLEVAQEWLARARGKIHVIYGNHDKLIRRERKAEILSERFEWRKDYHELKIWDEEMDLTQDIILSHYPMLVWNKAHHGSFMLHGHCHSTLPDDPGATRIDVGVDAQNYSPISYQEVKELMTKKVFRPVDHHKGK